MCREYLGAVGQRTLSPLHPFRSEGSQHRCVAKVPSTVPDGAILVAGVESHTALPAQSRLPWEATHTCTKAGSGERVCVAIAAQEE